MRFESVSHTIRRVLFLFIYVWVVVGRVRHLGPLWPPGWPWLLPKMPPLCLIFDIYLFALWMNMQNWKDLLVSVYPCYRGPFISARLWSVGRPLPSPDAAPAIWLSACVRSRLSVHAIWPLSSWSWELAQVCINSLSFQMLKLSMNRPRW